MHTLIDSAATKTPAFAAVPAMGIQIAESKRFYPNMKSKPGVKSGRKAPGKTADMKQMADCIRAIATRKDRQAFEELFRFYAPRLKAVLMKSGAGAQEARELVGDDDTDWGVAVAAGARATAATLDPAMLAGAGLLSFLGLVAVAVTALRWRRVSPWRDKD